MILDALKAEGYNRTRCARRLGWTRCLGPENPARTTTRRATEGASNEDKTGGSLRRPGLTCRDHVGLRRVRVGIVGQSAPAPAGWYILPPAIGLDTAGR